MAATPDESMRQQPADVWGPQDDQSMGPADTIEPLDAPSLPPSQDQGTPDFHRGSSVGDGSVSGSKGDNLYREKQVKPNKVYVGGLPEHTRQEDLQGCFGKIGNITNIELKIGYGFVEFDTREAAQESVEKYNEGYFMGNKIRVELSHGGGRTAKYTGDPGACFKCGQMGHWARECPNQPVPGIQRRHNYDNPLIDRIQRDYPPPAKNYPPRDDFGRHPPARDARYDYSPVPPRDFRRPPSPRGDYRDYPPAFPPPPPRGRDYDEYRRGPPSNERDRYAPPAPPPSEHRGRYQPPPDPAYRGGYSGPPPPANFYDRYDRRSAERYPPAYPPSGGRARTPPRGRDDFDRALPPSRDYIEFRGRPPSPPARYVADYQRPGSAEIPPQRYRRRSESPPRASAFYDQPYASSNSGGGFSGNGYPGNGPPPGPPSRGGGSRDYPPPPRNGRDLNESMGGGYRRT